MPKFVNYDGRRFLQVSDRSAMRHSEPYRVEVLKWDHPGGEVQYKSRPVSPRLYNSVKSMMEGIV